MDPDVVPERKSRLRDRRPSRRFLAVLAVGLALVGVVAGFIRASGRAMHDYDSGPVRTNSDTITGQLVEVGQVFTFGTIVLENVTDQPAVLERIRTEPPLRPPMSLVAVMVAGDGRRVGFVGTDLAFPPPSIPSSVVRPFEGAVVPGRPGDPREVGVEVLMGLRMDQPGEFGFRHVVFDYRIGKKRHSVRGSDGFVACAPVQNYPSGCRSRTYFEPED